MAPFAHTKDVHCQDVQSAMAEESRLAVEEVTKKTDPYGATKDALEKDVYAFSREYKNFSQRPDVKMEEFVFWFLMILMRIHRSSVHLGGIQIGTGQWEGRTRQENWNGWRRRIIFGRLSQK